MKVSRFVTMLGVLFLFLTAFTCETNNTNDDSLTCDERVLQLNKMKTKIQNLADTSICNENLECRFIAFGSKPCGGPWSYLVYSSSIDTEKLSKLVKEHNQLETIINKECQRFSDCAMVNPPQRLECENNKCIAIY